MLYYTRGRISGMLFHAREAKIPIVPWMLMKKILYYYITVSLHAYNLQNFNNCSPIKLFYLH